MYELIESIKGLGRDINDSISGKKVEQAIKEELNNSRSLSGSIKLEPIILLESLRISNKIKACGLNEEQVDDMLRRYMRGFQNDK